MSERLRRLERAWLESGSLADEAAFLFERVRSGEWTRDRLELAAAWSPAAAEACPPLAVREPLDLDYGSEIDAYLGRFFAAPEPSELGLEFLRRAALAATRGVFGESALVLGEGALADLESLARSAYPTLPHLLDGIVETGLLLAEDSLLGARGKTVLDLQRISQAFRDGFYQLSFQEMAAQSVVDAVVRAPEELLVEVACCLCACLDQLEGEEEDRPFTASLDEQICQEVLPWLLERGDPLAERVARRRP